MWALLMLAVTASATNATRRIYGMIPSNPTSSFMEAQRRAFVAEFDPVLVYDGPPDETYAQIDDLLATTPGAEIAVVFASAGPITAYAAAVGRLLDAGAAVLTVAQRTEDAAIAGLDADRHLFWGFEVVEKSSAELVAAEVCRQTGPNFRHVVMLVYGAPFFDGRVDAIGPWLEANCGASVVVTHAIRSPEWSADVAGAEASKALSVDPAITTIFSCNNELLTGVLPAVRNHMSRQKADKLYVTGYNAPDFDAVQKSGWVLASGAIGGEYMRTIWTILDVIAAGRNTTAAVAAHLGTDQTHTTFEGTARYFDARGYTKSSILAAYDVEVRPPCRGGGDSPLEVRVGLSGVVVDEIDTALSQVRATYWLEAVWHDPRLTYDETITPGPLRVGSGEVWAPSFFAANTMTPDGVQLIKQLPTSVAADGTVRFRARFGGEFLCEMNIKPYPYDAHVCAIEISSGATVDEVALVADLGFEIGAGGPEGWYEPRSKAPVAYVGTWSRVDACGVAECAGGDEPRVSYPIELVRNPRYIVRSFILVGWAFNVLAFGAFWMHDAGDHGIDRGALSLAGIIASSFMLYEAKETHESTWLDMYFSVMLVFQFVAFLLVLVSSRRELTRASRRERAGRPDGARRRPVAVSLTHPAAARMRRRSRTYWAHRHFFGGRDVPPVDRAVRFVVVPGFLVVQILLCLAPWSGSGDITGHKDAGTKNPLFALNVACLACYAGLAAAGRALRRSGDLLAKSPLGCAKSPNWDEPDGGDGDSEVLEVE